MSSEERTDKRAKLLMKNRKMKVKKKEVDEDNNTNYHLTSKDGKVILQCITGKRVIGIDFVRGLNKLIEESDADKGIIVSDVKYTYSAKANAPSYNVELIPPTLPSFDIFKHDLVSPVKLLTEEEKHEIVAKYNAKPYQFPKIPYRDPISIIIGAEPGDIIEFTSDSITAGESVKYRYVS